MAGQIRGKAVMSGEAGHQVRPHRTVVPDAVQQNHRRRGQGADLQDSETGHAGPREARKSLHRKNTMAMLMATATR